MRKKKNKIYVFVQARLTSSRLPNKVFLKLNKITVIENIFLRLKYSKYLDDIIFIIPSNSKNLGLKNFLIKKKIPFFCGLEKNVLKRFYKASNEFKPDVIVRITADCPLVDYRLMDHMLKNFLKSENIDYLSNTLVRSFPDGLDIEIFTKKALTVAYNKAYKKYDLEHVTPYIQKNLRCLNYSNDKDLSRLKWTLDTMGDYNRLKKIFSIAKIKNNSSWKKILEKGV